MTIDISPLINSPFGVRLALGVGRIFPRRLGYGLANMIGGRMASQKGAAIVRAIRANQWVARGERISESELDQAVRTTLQNTAHSLFDLYHYSSNHKEASSLIVLDETTSQLARRPEFSQRGLMIVGLHISGFDLALQWLCQNGMKLLVLTIPDPQGGRRTEYEMRKKTGMNLLPASVSAVRQALRHLQQGGLVLTGIDRPIPNAEARPCFFGRPASLPMHHIFLASKARVPVLIMAPFLFPDGKYHILTSDPIEMESHPNREMQALRNAENVLSIAEGFIRQAPQQWSMSLPVWPEAMGLVPT